MMNKACLIASCLLLLANISLPANAQSWTKEQIKAMTLPPTHLDSFVHHALLSGHAEHIYGDEGTNGPPPQYGFNIKHRINIGIVGERDEGLTTGHGSYLPDAWGSDEFLRPPGAWSLSGVNHGNHMYNGVDGNDNSPSNEGGSPWGDNQDNYNSNGETGGQQGPIKLPYEIGPGWIGVNNTHDGGLMGYMAPGESLYDFMTGKSGHILPQYAAEGKWIAENQLPLIGAGK